MVSKRHLYTLTQGRFETTFHREEEVMLELTIPISRDRDLFRVGWSLKGLRNSGWLAISTGEEKWPKGDTRFAAVHTGYLLEAAVAFVEDEKVVDQGL